MLSFAVRLISVSVLLILAGPGVAQTNDPMGKCPGSVKQTHPHPYGNFNFETNSRHDEVGKLNGVSIAGRFK